MTKLKASKRILILAAATVVAAALLWILHLTLSNTLQMQIRNYEPNVIAKSVDLKNNSAKDTDPVSYCVPSGADLGPTRACGWKLFDAYFNHRDVPVWRDKRASQQDKNKWYTKCSMNPELSQYCSDSAMSNSLSHTPLNLRQLQSPGGGKDLAGEDPPLPTVYYNASAAKTIQDNRLGSGQALQHLITTAKKSPASIPQFGPDAVVVKEIWEALPVPVAPGSAKGVTQLAVYDSRYYPPTISNGLGNFNAWPVQVPILLDAQGKPDTQQPCNPKTYGLNNDQPPNPEAIPINCFVYIDFTAGSKKCSDTAQGGLLSPIPLEGNQDYPCFAVLVGFHIATHRINTWTWSTFWWENDAFNDKTYHDSGAYITVDPRYSHYVMNTTFGPAWDDISTILNPYLEGVSGGIIQQNCYFCHTNAVYVPIARAADRNRGRTGANIAFGTAVRPCTLPAADPITAGCPLNSSFLFSIPDNQNESQQPALFVKHFRTAR